MDTIIDIVKYVHKYKEMKDITISVAIHPLFKKSHYHPESKNYLRIHTYKAIDTHLMEKTFKERRITCTLEKDIEQLFHIQHLELNEKQTNN